METADNTTQSTTYDTLILGAGAAGLAAAHTLSGTGQRVALLEARASSSATLVSLPKAVLAKDFGKKDPGKEEASPNNRLTKQLCPPRCAEHTSRHPC